MSATKESPRITTLNANYPGGAGGTRVDYAKYVSMARAILRALPRVGPGVPFAELAARVRPTLPRALWARASVPWYVTTVKLDLEARGMVARVGRAPQRLVRQVSLRASLPRPSA
ncbi:MAG: hypothetical protein IT376_22790 [Polyangiaceae bacterium]|nr:hypothetical protein [Polyangiaceae bacterium]